ncbi:MAG: dipeptide ABC transporter ATP-binding protein [Cyanobacteria bacterium SIG26]|nr:dipeptide ABC transporter ATP-binding protein [Cyanobacteria bacterium SIG26]
MNKDVIEVKDLDVVYESKTNVFGNVKKIYALNDVSLNVKRGEILAIAGESGCGKSTLAKTLMRLIEPLKGEILLEGQNICSFKGKAQQKDFYKKLQMIFQNPYASLNPKMKIGEILQEPLLINTNFSKVKIQALVDDVIGKVGLDNSCLNLYPHEFSGGQRQRIAIARALILEPEIIIADEPVSALDVSIQAQIINLLKQLKDDFNLTFIFISHDLGVIRHISDRIAIMYLGEIVEIGKTEDIFIDPKHPYTKALLSAVPELTANKKKEHIKLIGELPSPENLPSGCKFHTRCPFAMDVCKQSHPAEFKFAGNHSCKCFLYSDDNIKNSVI